MGDSKVSSKFPRARQEMPLVALIAGVLYLVIERMLTAPAPHPPPPQKEMTSEVREDVKELKADVSELQQDVAVNSNTLGAIRVSIDEIKEEVKDNRRRRR